MGYLIVLPYVWHKAGWASALALVGIALLTDLECILIGRRWQSRKLGRGNAR